MSATISGILIGLFTGIVTTIAGAAIWTYYLKGKIDSWLQRRRERKEKDEQVFQEKVKDVLQHPLMEADYIYSILARSIGVIGFSTMVIVLSGLFFYLLSELVSNVFSVQVHNGYLAVILIWASTAIIAFGRELFKLGQERDELWSVVKEARQRQEGRLPDPAKHLSETEDSTKQ